MEAHFHIRLTASYISTKDNDISDDLSHNRIILFHSKMPQADSIPTPIPPSLPSLLFNPLMELGVASLDRAVQQYFQLGIAHSTHKTHKAAMNQFHVMYATHNITDPFPATEQMLCYFAAFLANKEMAPQSIRTYLSVQQNAQISMGYPDPRNWSTLPVLKRVQCRHKVGPSHCSKLSEAHQTPDHN